MKLLFCLQFITILLSQQILAQNKKSIGDYNRAVSFMWKNMNNKKMFNLYIQSNWFADSTGLWYKSHSIEDKKYLKISFPDLEKSDLFDHQLRQKTTL